MPSTNSDCPLEYAISLLKGKWRIRILWLIYQNGSVRFNELKHSLVGISDMVLTNCLKDFADHGLVVRTQFNELPLRVEYTLSDHGRALLQALDSMRNWSHKQISTDQTEHANQPQ